MNVKNRGFGSMNKTKQREIARRGGQAAHAKGTAHQWTSETAKLAAEKSAEARKTKATDDDAAEESPAT